jgi:hypothetical protein
MSWNYGIGHVDYFRSMQMNRFTSLNDYFRSTNYRSVMQSLVMRVRELVGARK